MNASFYPHTGAHDEVGGPKAIGSNINIPINVKGAGDEEYKEALVRLVLPIIREFQPNLVVVSAGFDAAAGDPLGGMNVSTEGFAWLTRQLQLVCKDINSKLVMALEGGYNITSVSSAVCACVSALLGDELPPPPPNGQDLLGTPSKREQAKIEARKEQFKKDLEMCVNLQKKYHPILTKEEKEIDSIVQSLANVSIASPPRTK